MYISIVFNLLSVVTNNHNGLAEHSPVVVYQYKVTRWKTRWPKSEFETVNR